MEGGVKHFSQFILSWLYNLRCRCRRTNFCYYHMLVTLVAELIRETEGRDGGGRAVARNTKKGGLDCTRAKIFGPRPLFLTTPIN